MFKKLSKGLLDHEVMPVQTKEESKEKAHAIAPSFATFEALKAHAPLTTLSASHYDTPDVHIGENASMEGSLSFETLAKIEGHFSGELLSKGKIIIGPNAIVKADLFLEEAYISGRVEGNITINKKLVLSGSAQIIGDITAPSLTVEEGVSIRGQLHVTKIASPTEKEEELPFSDELMQ